MNDYQYILFLVFSIIAVMMILDNNVGVYLTLIFKILQSNTSRFFWMIRFHPNNFVTTWVRNREYNRIARELQKELESK
jgi:hypothetical protein